MRRTESEFENRLFGVSHLSAVEKPSDDNMYDVLRL